jgi:hypothetical protein
MMRYVNEYVSVNSAREDTKIACANRELGYRAWWTNRKQDRIGKRSGGGLLCEGPAFQRVRIKAPLVQRNMRMIKQKRYHSQCAEKLKEGLLA